MCVRSLSELLPNPSPPVVRCWFRWDKHGNSTAAEKTHESGFTIALPGLFVDRFRCSCIYHRLRQKARGSTSTSAAPGASAGTPDTDAAGQPDLHQQG